MIINQKQMKDLERSSNIDAFDLVMRAGTSIAAELESEIPYHSNLLILCGSGNNGADGFVIANALREHYNVHVILTSGKPKTEEAVKALSLLPKKTVSSLKTLPRYWHTTDAIVDCIYGIGFHGELDPDMHTLFQAINVSGMDVYSVDVNSGCEADTGHVCRDAIVSKITYVIEYLKPCHLLNKEQHLFSSCKVISIGLPKLNNSEYLEMDEDRFFDAFPHRPIDAYKGMEGKMLLIGGSYGMAGAIGLNILGAKTMGASYIHCALPNEIYSIAAGYDLTPVFHPFGRDNLESILKPLIVQSSSIGFGSGCVNTDRKADILDMILQEARVPVVLDAEALRLLDHNTFILRFAKAPVILTPHYGELSNLTNLSVSKIKERKIEILKRFTKDYNVTVVLKGPNTTVVFPDGEVYINETGNQALAKAGSGDVLTGMMTALLTEVKDVKKAVIMAVWLHGYLAEKGTASHSLQNFDIRCYPDLMDQLFKKHGY